MCGKQWTYDRAKRDCWVGFRCGCQVDGFTSHSDRQFVDELVQAFPLRTASAGEVVIEGTATRLLENAADLEEDGRAMRRNAAFDNGAGKGAIAEIRLFG